MNRQSRRKSPMRGIAGVGASLLLGAISLASAAGAQTGDGTPAAPAAPPAPAAPAPPAAAPASPATSPAQAPPSQPATPDSPPPSASAPAGASSAPAASPTSPTASTPSDTALSASDKDARDVLARMAAAYKDLKSFSATVQMAGKQNGKDFTQTSKLSYQMGKARAEVKDGKGGSSTIVFDGKTLFQAASSDPKSYKKAAVGGTPEGVQRTFGPGTVGLLGLLLVDPAVGGKILPSGAKSVALDPKGDTVSGTPVDVVKAALPDGTASLRFDIAKTDHLLRRVTISLSGAQNGNYVAETYSDVQSNPTLAPATFTFTPPAGATAEESAAEPPMYDPRVKVGATPFAVAGNDLDSKPVSLEQYKGKVVLLDFWATWCGPCREEVPNVVAAYNKYHARGFDVIGISLDQSGDRAKVVQFAKEHSMPWRQIYDGGFWQAKMAKAYGVQAIPFAVLIGKDGKIAAVEVRGDGLDTAIQAALAAK